jgi:hypothetical protein
MKTDIVGKIRNTDLPKTRPLYPLFEAVSNAIHSIEDSKNGKGFINIVLFRALDNSLFNNIEVVNSEIISTMPYNDIVVEDNGIGFDDNNYDSFQTAESTHKINRGAKGVGRFVWLKAFKSVNIKSNFNQKGKWQLRLFDFIPIGNGIDNHNLNDSEEKKLRTVVHLRNMDIDVQKNFPKKLEEISWQLIYHFLTIFIRPDCPKISLQEVSDGNKSEELNLNKLFEDEVKAHQINKSFTLKKQNFQLIIVRNYSSYSNQHTVSYCAVYREVLFKKLNLSIPDLSGKIEDDEGKKFVYQVYVSSKYFDDNVNSERTRFRIIDKYDENGINFSDTPSLQEVHDRTISSIEDSLSEWLKIVRTEKEIFVKDYIQNEAPQYAPVLKYAHDSLKSIPSNLSKDKLDNFLHSELHLLEKKNREQVNKFLNKNLSDVRDIQSYIEEFNKYIETVNDFGKSQLAKYIIHRHTILRLLDKQFGLNEEGKYSLEETIHNTIFPIRQVSDEITFESHNLWMIDERLAYHLYLASDKYLDSVEQVDNDNHSRLDLLIFKNRFALTTERDTPQSVVIVEFKRPQRDDYRDNEKNNPISQVYRYISELRDGKMKDKRGEFIKLSPNTPFYIYIIADETPSFTPLIKSGDFITSPDGLGHFKYHDYYKAYIEIISYRKLLKDAKQRNRILFDKLGLPTF